MTKLSEIPRWKWFLGIVILVGILLTACYVAALFFVPDSWKCHWPLYMWTIRDPKERYDFQRGCQSGNSINNANCVNGDIMDWTRTMCDMGGGCGTYKRRPSQQENQVRCDPSDKNWKKLQWINMTNSKCDYDQCYAPSNTATRIGDPYRGYLWKNSPDTIFLVGTSKFEHGLKETCAQTLDCVGATSQQVTLSDDNLLDESDVKKYIPEGKYPVTNMYIEGYMLSSLPDIDQLTTAEGASSFYWGSTDDTENIGTWKWQYGGSVYI